MKNLLSFLLIFSILVFSNCKIAQESKEKVAEGETREALKAVDLKQLASLR